MPRLESSAGAPSTTHGSKYPLEIYLQNIERAKSGDARSQYRVAQALQKCRSAIKSEKRLDEVIRTVPMSEEQAETIKQRYALCKEFASLTPDIDGEITSWLHQAAENDDPLAKAYEALLSYPKVDDDEVKMLVGDALKSGDREAYSLAVMYFANIASNDNAELYEAWLLISCDAGDECDVAKERERIKSQYQMYQRMQIGTYESELREKLRLHQWNQLGF